MEAAKGGTVLLVEDDPVLTRIYRRALVAAGNHVDQATDGAAGMERLVNGKYDAVVSDICMPRLSGLDLLEGVRRLNIPVPVILMTAQLDADGYSRARELGTVRYLLKPVAMAQLAHAVEQAVKISAIWRRRQERSRRMGLVRSTQ
jgi:DNA-binding NtrC family response regulator